MILHQIHNSVGNHNYNTYIYTDTVWPLHFHGNYELIYTFEGSTEVCINGITEQLETGYFILVSPYITHSLNISKDARTWVCVFSKDYIADFASRYQFTSFSKFKCDESFESFLLQNLLHDRKTERYLLTACLCLICGQCIKNAKSSAPGNDTTFVKKAVIYITENLERNITMSDVARELNYEYHYFSSLFHEYFSINFRKFLNIMRFEQACEMLSKKEHSITEVCRECGFASIRNFNRIFKTLSGMTPYEYRNGLRKKDDR